MEKKTLVVLALLLLSGILAACGPSQVELDAQATEIAANIFATQTAEAPTSTPTSSPTSTPTSTPTLTPTPTPTPTATFPQLPVGWRYHILSGFQIALPERWEVVDIERKGFEAIWSLIGDLDTEWAQSLTSVLSAEAMQEAMKFWAMDIEPAGIGYAIAIISFQPNPFPIRIESLCAQMKSLYEQIDIEVVESICGLKINGLDAARFTVRLRMGALAVKEIQYVYVQETRFWTLTLGADETGWVDYEQSFDIMAESFRVEGQDYDQTIIELSVAIYKDPENAKNFFDRGLTYYNRGNLDHAIADFDQAISINPQYSEAYIHRGLSYMYKDDFDLAIVDFDQAIAINPHSALAYYNRGVAYHNNGELDQAISDYDQAINLDPHYSLAYHGRGIAYHNKGDLDQAISDYDKAIYYDPQCTDAYFNRRLAYDTKGNLNQVIGSYTLAILRNPEDVYLYYTRALLYEDIGDLESAINDYEQYLELSDDPYWIAEAEKRLDALQKVSTICVGIQRNMRADRIFGEEGSQPGQFNHPADVALNQEGEIYLADTYNHRIQHLSPEGEVLHTWGQFTSIEGAIATGGTFNEPWGIGVAPDGTVYVADTWNHRILYFTATGEFLGMFGTFGRGQSPTDFWAPRDVAIDSQGHVYVADTGNKRIVIFDKDGVPLGILSQGSGGGEGELDEPVGIAVSDDGRVFVADAWNHRIQIFSTDGHFLNQWPVYSLWYERSWYNKPYIALDGLGGVYITDPKGNKVMVFNESGDLQYCFRVYETGGGSRGRPIGLTFDNKGGLYIVDAANDRLLYFVLED